MTPWIIAGALCAGAFTGWALVRGGTMKPTPKITLRMEDGQEHHLAPPVIIDVSGLRQRVDELQDDRDRWRWVAEAAARSRCLYVDGDDDPGVFLAELLDAHERMQSC